MKKIDWNSLGYLVLTLLSCFLLGAYTASEIKCGIKIEDYRWGVSTILGFVFLVLFLTNYRKDNN
jgi:hypothetical protein